MAVLIPDNTTSLGGVLVNSYLLTTHNPRKISMPTTSMAGKVIGVTIHNTDWINTASNTTPAEQYTRATVNGNMKTVRVHYYVDHKCAWQNLPLSLTGWHAADGSGKGNMRTIAIECIMSKNYNATDKASEDNAARLAAALLKQYGLTINSLYTHTHWLNVRDGKTGTVDYLNQAKNSYKMCPLYILPHWGEFKAKVAFYMGESTESSKLMEDTNKTKTSPNEFIVKIVCKDLNVRKGPGVEHDKNLEIHSGEAYTIVETARATDGGTWGKLKSGAGWINISEKFVRRV